MPKKADEDFGPWNPGVESEIPGRLLACSTIFDQNNVTTHFLETRELANLTGLPPHTLSKFCLERLLVHELLIRVTCDLSVPDGPEYEELGLNLRGMVHRLFESHFRSRLADYQSEHDALLAKACSFMDELLDDQVPVSEPSKNAPWYRRIFGSTDEIQNGRVGVTGDKDKTVDTRLENVLKGEDAFQIACARALKTIRNAFSGKQGFIPREGNLIVNAAMILFNNEYGSVHLRRLMDRDFQNAAAREGYVFLPSQREPVVLNVKGASAAGKSTIRSEQRELAKRLGVAWEDFALVSPDYWRKYLLDYSALGDDYKYGAMLTGRELEIVDRKLDDYMAHKAASGSTPHLLIDRFRFDSFTVDDREGAKSSLLSRFGDTIFLFFMITPPEETVVRAWERGLSTGRYKAVDDLLYHNVEAYTGMPQLFLSWALSDKKVHWEFLNNDVPIGKRPRCAAFGWNDEMNVLDLESLANIDQFRSINIEADGPDEVYETSPFNHSFEFVKRCVKRLSAINFIDPKSGETYARIFDGKWEWCDHATISALPKNSVVRQGLHALGWREECSPKPASSSQKETQIKMKYILGDWYGRSG